MTSWKLQVLLLLVSEACVGAVRKEFVQPSVFREDFSSQKVNSTMWGFPDLKVTSGCNGKARCLRATYVPSSRGSPRLVKHLPIQAGTEYTLTYSVFFEPDFQFVMGGKLPGLGGGSVTTGCQPQTPAGWSYRLMWWSQDRLQIYLYDQKRVAQKVACGRTWIVPNFKFQKGQWYKLGLYVKLNDPPTAANGEIKLAIDDGVVLTQTGLQLRGDVEPNVALVDTFAFATFYGGDDATWAPKNVTHAQFADFVIRPGDALSTASAGR